MHADAHFVIGRDHRVCEDFAGIGPAVAALSDGCSTTPETDLGARLLVRAAIRAIRPGGDSGRGPLKALAPALVPALVPALKHAHAIGAPIDCLDGTLLQIEACADAFEVSAVGDGFVAARLRDGGWRYWWIEYPSGAPLYVSYLLEPPRRAAWVAAFGKQREVRCWDGAAWQPAQEGPGGHPDHPWQLRLDIEAYDLALVFSDGVASARIETGERVPPELVLQRLTAFKGTAGRFATRRLRRFAQREALALGWRIADDLSVAGWAES